MLTLDPKNFFITTTTIFLSFFILTFNIAGASDHFDPYMYTIDQNSIVIKEIHSTSILKQQEFLVPTNEDNDFFSNKMAETETSLDVIISNIINIGKQVWTIVEAGKPVVDVKTEYATATPLGLSDWMQLSEWKNPLSREYQLIAKNLYGMTVVKFSYKVLWTYGGRYKGKGKYLTNVSVLPTTVDVMWGYNFSSHIKIPTVVNVGTETDPIAGIQVDLYWNVQTVIKVSSGEASYFVRGDGNIREL